MFLAFIFWVGLKIGWRSFRNLLFLSSSTTTWRKWDIWQENLFSQKWRRFANFEAGCKKSPQTKFRQKTFFCFPDETQFFLPQFVEIIWHGVTFCCCLVFCSNYGDYGLFVFLASWNWISRSAGKVLVCLRTWVWCFFVDFFRNIFFTEMWFQFFFFRNTKFNFILKQKKGFDSVDQPRQHHLWLLWKKPTFEI